MSDVFYKDMAGIALDIIDEFQQGTLALERRTPVAGAPEWEPQPPQIDTYPVVGVVRSVDRRYVDGTLVMATDRMATVPAYSLPVGVVPNMADGLIVDGQPCTIKKMLKVPEAGVTIVYKMILGS
jgi:hypothetical protein